MDMDILAFVSGEVIFPLLGDGLPFNEAEIFALVSGDGCFPSQYLGPGLPMRAADIFDFDSGV